MNPETLTATEAAAAIQSGQLAPGAYVESLLRRIDSVEPTVRAWTTIDRPAVLAEARRMDEEARRKQFRGPLHGIPVGIKDIFYTRDLRTTVGSSIFENFIPTYDADVVEKLKSAGALILGKCVTTRLIFLDPGPTRNPWNPRHTPGGSSSGSAAAVAAGMCPLSIGSQTVGSVGRPGGYNGVVSLVPTQSRVSLRGAFPLAWSLDHVGAFSRCVRDMKLLTSVLVSPAPAPATKRTVTRVGVLRGFFYDNAYAETRQKLDALFEKLARSGFEVEEARLPDIFELAGPVLRTIVRAEAAGAHHRLIQEYPEAYGPRLRQLVQLGLLIGTADYLHASRVRRHYQREMIALASKFDVLLTPAAPGTAPEGIEATGDPVMNGPWTLADFPTMTLPYALATNGLPLGVQISAIPFLEEQLLDVAAAIEESIGFDARPAI
jgi:aspartyl-tRNA(Asn)/glutamyl-tRNA(Gln) amidotransferase subunit A